LDLSADLDQPFIAPLRLTTKRTQPHAAAIRAANAALAFSLGALCKAGMKVSMLSGTSIREALSQLIAAISVANAPTPDSTRCTVAFMVQE
jgi:hypothetical protein